MIPTAVDTTAGPWDSATASTVINDPDPRRVDLQSFMSLIGSHGFDGIQIADEDLPAEDRDCFSGFVTDLGQAVHQAGKVLDVTVHVKEGDVGRRGIPRAQPVAGPRGDREGRGPGPPDGPRPALEHRAERPHRRPRLGAACTRILRDTDPGGPDPFGGRPFRYDRVDTTASNLTRRQVVALAGQNRVDETWDVGAQSPHFSCTADGVQHNVWHENGRSAAAKFDLAGQYRLGGVERWRLGGEDPAGWEPGP